MFTLAVSLTVLAAGADPIKVAAPGLEMVNVEAEQSAFYTNHLAQLMNYEGVRVLTSADVSAILGHERQQQLVGCPDDKCKAEISKMLGVDGLLIGQVVKLDRQYKLDVKILEPGSGTPLAAASASTADKDSFVAIFSLVARQLAQQLSARLGRELQAGQAEVITQWSSVKRMGWLPAALGAGAAAAGGVGLYLSNQSYAELSREGRDPTAAAGSPNGLLTPDQASALVQQGQTQQLLGWTGVGVGAALLATAAGMFIFGGDEVVSAGVAVGPGGSSSLNVVGVW